MKHTLLFILLTTFIISSCSSATPVPEELEQAKEDIYRVLASPYCEENVVYIDLQLTSYTLSDKQIDYIRRELPSISQEVLESYISANTQIENLGEFSDFPIDCDYQFTTPDTQVWCNQSHCITPIGFSPIGVNSSLTEAMVYMYWTCWECGGWGRIYLLEKEDDSWVIVHFVELWIS